MGVLVGKTSHACATDEGHTADTPDKCSLEPRLGRDNLSSGAAQDQGVGKLMVWEEIFTTFSYF